MQPHAIAAYEVINGIPTLVNRPVDANAVMEVISKQLSEPDPEDPESANFETIVRVMIGQAKKGDRYARQEIWDRMMGRPAQTVMNMNVGATLSDFLLALEPPPTPPAPIMATDAEVLE
jgi:hypothetical protein